jgi:hypothetical protein
MEPRIDAGALIDDVHAECTPGGSIQPFDADSFFYMCSSILMTKNHIHCKDFSALQRQLLPRIVSFMESFLFDLAVPGPYSRYSVIVNPSALLPDPFERLAQYLPFVQSQIESGAHLAIVTDAHGRQTSPLKDVTDHMRLSVHSVARSDSPSNGHHQRFH